MFIWDLAVIKQNNQKPNFLYKFDSERLISVQAMIEYDYRLFPFIIAQSVEGEILIMQLTTGKTQRLKYKSNLMDHHISLNIEGSRRMI